MEIAILTILIIKAVKIFLIAYTISRFTPIEMILELLPDKLIYNLLRLLMSCSRCLALWVGIILTGNIWLAMSVSFFMVIFEKTFGFWEKKIRLN
jgi:hypothetical protein